MDTARYRQRLLALERELDARIARDVAAAHDTREDQPDPGDQGVVDELREGYLGLAETDSEILANVRAALGRIDAGTFGLCAVDSEPIPEARLDAVPWTPYCVRHQEELEAVEGLRTPRS
jgi:RNA polymerase-binding transcription factor DksA